MLEIRRREFIAALGGAAAWPLAARAQQGNRVRSIGVLIAGDESNPQAKANISAFTQALAGLGWTDGCNVRMDLRWYGGDIDRIRGLAQEWVGSQPDIILAQGTPASVALQRETRTIPRERPTYPRSRKHLRAWVGPMAVTCGWTFGGPAVTSIGYERPRRSQSACNPT